MALDLVFCGTPLFAVPTLEKLTSGGGFHVRLVVTQPDRPKGRGLERGASPVKRCAEDLGLAVTQPDRIKHNEEFRAQLSALRPDAIIVVGYGRIIPPWMLDLPRWGNINLHASLLPKYRGAAPIQWAIANGDAVTGVTTMRIDAGLDTGDILLQEALPIGEQDTSDTLAPVLAARGADLMVRTLGDLETGRIQGRPQDPQAATLAPILRKEDGLMDFSRPAGQILNRLRGFQPWPGAYTRFRGKHLQILRVQPAPPGVAAAELQVRDGHIFVGCGEDTSLELLELQLEGKKRTTARDFQHGYRIQPGESLG